MHNSGGVSPAKRSKKHITYTIRGSESTLSSEVKRNSGQRCYHCQQAQVKVADRLFKLQNYRNLTLEKYAAYSVIK